MAEWTDVTYVPDQDGEEVLVSTEDDVYALEVGGEDNDIPIVYIEAQEDEESTYNEQEGFYKDAVETQTTEVTSPQSEPDTTPGQAKRRKKGKVHICEECGMSFAATSSYKRHLLIHSDLRPFECADCGRRFRSRTNLLQHILIHTKIKPHQCSDCGKSFSRSTHLKIHSCQRRCPAQNMALLAEKKSRNDDEEPVDVSEVDISVQEEEVLTAATPAIANNDTPAPPLMIMKNDADDEAATCDICGAYFVKKSGLRRHKALSHRESDMNSSKNSFCCSVCKAKFAFLGLLEKHMRSHQVTMGFRCDQCGETFEKRTDVECHIAAHNLTNKQSVSQAHTVTAEMTASPSSVLIKPIAQTRAPNAIQLQQPKPVPDQGHNAKSLLMYPYECQTCKERFATALLLSSHQALHCLQPQPIQQQPPRTRQCPRCKKQFSSENSLTVHHCVPLNSIGSQQRPRTTTVQLPTSSSVGAGVHAVRSARSSSVGNNFMTSTSKVSVPTTAAVGIRRAVMAPVNNTRPEPYDTPSSTRRLVTTTRTVMPEPPPLTSQAVKEPKTRPVGQTFSREQTFTRQNAQNKSVELTPVTVIDSKGKSMKAYIIPNSQSATAASPRATKSEPPQLVTMSSRSGGAPANVGGTSPFATTNKRSPGSALGGNSSAMFVSPRGSSPFVAAHSANAASMKLARPLQSSSYRCGECRFTTLDYKEYGDHVALHRRDQQFACQYCPYSTRQQVSLERHQRTHNLGSSMEHISTSVIRNPTRKPVIETIEIPEGLFD